MAKESSKASRAKTHTASRGAETDTDPFSKEREAKQKKKLQQKGPGTAPLEIPTDSDSVILPQGPHGAMDVAQWMIKSVATAKIGFLCFFWFAMTYQLQAYHPVLFKICMCVGFIVDIILALIVVALVTYLLTGVAYAILRTLGVANEVDHIIIVIGRQFGLAL